MRNNRYNIIHFHSPPFDYQRLFKMTPSYSLRNSYKLLCYRDYVSGTFSPQVWCLMQIFNASLFYDLESLIDSSEFMLSDSWFKYSYNYIKNIYWNKLMLGERYHNSSRPSLITHWKNSIHSEQMSYQQTQLMTIPRSWFNNKKLTEETQDNTSCRGNAAS